MGPLKNETPMQESAYWRPKIASFLYFSIITAIGVQVFAMRLLKMRDCCLCYQVLAKVDFIL